MTAFGGYFGLELSCGDHVYHTTPYTFKSGRSSLHFILKLQRPTLVYVPFYTCDGVLESFEAAGTTYRFYSVNEKLEPAELPNLLPGEYFLYINYFDLKRSCVDSLSALYGDQLIVDCTQAFFMKGNGKSWFFNSSRKFFGVPDGSYLYSPQGVNIEEEFERNENYTVQHLLDRFNAHTRQGYQSFMANELLCDAELLRMSLLSEHLLSHVNYQQVIDRRRSNYQYLETILTGQNLCTFQLKGSFVPLCYPLLLPEEIDRRFLAVNNLFIPFYWKNVIERQQDGFTFEKNLSARLLPLPIDQRLSRESMEKILHILNDIR